MPNKDIKTDRFMAVLSGSAFCPDVFELIVDHPHMVAVRIRTDKEPSAIHPGCTASIGCITLSCEQVYGTVDEIVEHFRGNLVKCYNVLAHTDQGDDVVIPSSGIPNFGLLREAAARNGVTGFAILPQADPKWLEEIDKHNQAISGVPRSQDAHKQLLLERLIEEYGRVACPNRGHMMLSAPPDVIEMLIADLEVMKTERLAEKQRYRDSLPDASPSA